MTLVHNQRSARCAHACPAARFFPCAWRTLPARLRRNCARKPPPSTSPPAAVTLRTNGRKASNLKVHSCWALQQAQDGLRGSAVEAQANWPWLLCTDLE